MKNFTIVFTLIYLMVFADSKAQVIKITNDPNWFDTFKISQNDVVWSESTTEIGVPPVFHMMFYKGSTGVKTDIGEGRTGYNNFDIDNGKVVYEKETSNYYPNIMYFDGSSTSLFESEGINPAISGDNIAFFIPGHNIKLFTNGSFITTPTAGGTPWTLDLDQNNVVWDDGADLKIFDGSTVTTIPLSNDAGLEIKYFQIDGDKVIFVKGPSSEEANLYYYDGSTTIQLNTNRIAIAQSIYFNGSTVLEGDKIVWLEKPENINRAGSGYEVWYFDGDTKHLLESSDNSDIYFCTPSLSGNTIVWLKYNESSYPAFATLGVYDIYSEKIKYLDICPNCHSINTMYYIPRFSGNYFAWVTLVNSSENIYMADITTLSEVSNSGVNDLDVSDINISQNPVRDKLEITMSSGYNCGYNIQIINTSGQVIYKEANLSFSNSGFTTVDMCDLPNGLYIVNLSNEERIYTKKIIVLN
jgi:hypothetical protein